MNILNYAKYVTILSSVVFLSVLLHGAACAQPAPTIVRSPKQLTWGPVPPNFEKGAQIAVLEGEPGKPGLYAVRFKMPTDYRVSPHWHPADVAVTVISGKLGIGFGDKFDKSAGKLMNAGGFVVEPKEVHHYVWTEAPTILQVQGDGPLVTNYVNPSDDPSHNAH